MWLQVIFSLVSLLCFPPDFLCSCAPPQPALPSILSLCTSFVNPAQFPVFFPACSFVSSHRHPHLCFSILPSAAPRPLVSWVCAVISWVFLALSFVFACSCCWFWKQPHLLNLLPAISCMGVQLLCSQCDEWLLQKRRWKNVYEAQTSSQHKQPRCIYSLIMVALSLGGQQYNASWLTGIMGHLSGPKPSLMLLAPPALLLLWHVVVTSMKRTCTQFRPSR